MKRFLLAMLLLGIALLLWILARTDLGEVAGRLQQVGPAAATGVLLAFVAAHAALAGSWLLTLAGVPLRARWLWRVWRVLLVGSAIESATPFAGLGGEPVKAVLLKRHYGVSLPDASSSLVLTRMTDLVAQAAFIGIGLALLFAAGWLSAGQRTAAGVGFALFLAMILGFLAAQLARGFSRLREWLGRGGLGARLAGLARRANGAFDAAVSVEDQLIGFYREHRGRFAASCLCAFGEWTGNAVAVWIAVNALGHPIGFGDALVIEAFVALVRSTLFFVPGDVGTQEAALVLICSAATGSAETGLALAAIRRARDLLWIAVGLAVGGAYGLRKTPGASDPGADAPAPSEGRFSRLRR